MNIKYEPTAMTIKASIFPIYGSMILSLFINKFPIKDEKTTNKNKGAIIPVENSAKRIKASPATREVESIISRIGREQVKELNAYINP